MKNIDNRIIQLTEGRFYVGASNRIQKVITELNQLGYGGFEEFIGLPAMIGGMIYMNAGIGSENNSRFTMSDFVERVRAFDLETKDYIWLLNKDCEFSHRKSVFQTGKYIIVGCEIRLSRQDMEKSRERIAARKDYCRRNMEYGKGCFGTCFSRCSGKLVKLNALATKFKKMNVQQGRIKANWLVNYGDGTFDEAMTIIENCERLHKMFGKMISREVQIWE